MTPETFRGVRGLEPPRHRRLLQSSPDARSADPRREPRGDVYRGHDGLRQWMKDLQGVGDLRTTLTEIVSAATALCPFEIHAADVRAES